MYKALTRFADLRDGGRIYEAGEEYPRPGFDVAPERIKELAGSDNRAGHPLIMKTAEMPLEAVSDKDAEIHIETQKPARSRKGSRKKG